MLLLYGVYCCVTLLFAVSAVRPYWLLHSDGSWCSLLLTGWDCWCGILPVFAVLLFLEESLLLVFSLPVFAVLLFPVESLLLFLAG